MDEGRLHTQSIALAADLLYSRNPAVAFQTLATSSFKVAVLVQHRSLLSLRAERDVPTRSLLKPLQFRAVRL